MNYSYINLWAYASFCSLLINIKKLATHYLAVALHDRAPKQHPTWQCPLSVSSNSPPWKLPSSHLFGLQNTRHTLLMPLGLPGLLNSPPPSFKALEPHKYFLTHTPELLLQTPLCLLSAVPIPDFLQLAQRNHPFLPLLCRGFKSAPKCQSQAAAMKNTPRHNLESRKPEWAWGKPQAVWQAYLRSSLC